MNIPKLIAGELTLQQKQVDETLGMFAEGSTVPFIARYRKERTGGLDEDQLRLIEERFSYLNLLLERKQTVLTSIEEQGKLTDQLRGKIDACLKLQELEDLYLPYKPKRKTRGSIAKAKGLEPLALFMLNQPDFSGDTEQLYSEYINPELGVENTIQALQGAKDILAEMINEHAEIRKSVREYLQSTSSVKSERIEGTGAATENEKIKEKEKKEVYKQYYDFVIEISKIKQYQVLALNRGEAEKFLKVSFQFDDAGVFARIDSLFFKRALGKFREVYDEIIQDSFKRLLYPSLEREVRNALTEAADVHAIEMFALNLKQLLLQPPTKGQLIMGIDPGYVSGCKIAVIDDTGKYLEGDTIYPHEPKSRVAEAERKSLEMIKKYKVTVVAIGNGTASRETEQFIVDLIKKHSLELSYLLVNEAGASVYSASAVAKKEFPDLEASLRGNISIARRLLDPLAELVKIDPKSIGVGLYQHDVDQKLLGKKLDDVVESCVNYVGVNVNTASPSLLTYVSGLNKRLAENIVSYREKKGKFTSRQELMEVSGLGEKAFEQSAGFLKVPDSENPFDDTAIHPESYDAAGKLLKMFNMPINDLKETGGMIDFFVSQKGAKNVAKEVGVGEPTLNDIIENLKKPGRDPRDEMPKPILRSDVLKMEDLKQGMKLKGTVRNVIDFGAFVDIGVKQDALLHVSQMANRFIKNPLDVVNVGDVVDVTVLEIDVTRKRISLSMKS